MKSQILEAIDHALAGRWDKAHSIVQRFEPDRSAAWVHAVLHKIEGDEGNSQYWYMRAGKAEHAADNPQDELREIAKTLKTGE